METTQPGGEGHREPSLSGSKANPSRSAVEQHGGTLELGPQFLTAYMSLSYLPSLSQFPIYEMRPYPLPKVWGGLDEMKLGKGAEAQGIRSGLAFPAVCWLLSRVQHFVTPGTVACQAPHPWNSPGKNTGVGCHFLLQGNLPNSGIEPRSPAL